MEVAHEVDEEGIVSRTGRRLHMLAAEMPAHDFIFEFTEAVLLGREPRCGRDVAGGEGRRQQSQRGHDHLRERLDRRTLADGELNVLLDFRPDAIGKA